LSTSPVVTITAGERRLTALEFRQLAAVPAAVEWFASLDNPRTRRAYQNDLEDFCGFVGLASADEFRVVSRAHVLAWRADLESRGLAGTTIRRKLAALASLFDHLLENKPLPAGTQCTALNGQRSRATRARRRRWETIRLRPCSMRRMNPHSRDCAIGPSWQCCCTTGCDARKQHCCR
jgi:hypothetical protein